MFWAVKKIKTTLTLFFIMKKKKKKFFLQKSSVITLLNNSKLPDNKLKLNGNKIFVSLSKKDIKKDPVIRVVINEAGRTTNLQIINFYNGEIASNKKKQSNYDNIIYALLIDRFYDGDKSNSIPVDDPH